MIAHGLAVQAIHACGSTLEAGIVLSEWNVEPASGDPADIAAAEMQWNCQATNFLHPIFCGYYHPARLESMQNDLPQIHPGDMALISQKLDFLGINCYSRIVMNAQGMVGNIPGSEYTDMGWEVHAPTFRRVLNRINKDYCLPPIYITENGAAFPDVVGENGRVHDDRRIDYLRQHIEQLRLAMLDGVDVRGYFVWSLLDNFEWGWGFSKRFGVIRVDYETLKRTVKDSGDWYAQLISNNKIPAIRTIKEK
jgi:beta-glucosidase